MTALGQNGDLKNNIIKNMKFFNSGNITVLIAILLIAYALLSFFVH